MKRIEVPVKFEGIVEVDVPEHLCDEDQKSLAEAVALATVVATIDNPDCGECLEAAFDEWITDSDIGTSEEDFDAAKASGVCGDWTTSEGAS